MSKLTGIWHITEMGNWDKDYFNMEVQAYIELNEQGRGRFQFGLVTGYLDGEIVEDESGEQIEFTWEGADENDEAFGNGWVKLKDKDMLEGEIEFYQGDSSLFWAKRA